MVVVFTDGETEWPIEMEAVPGKGQTVLMSSGERYRVVDVVWIVLAGIRKGRLHQVVLELIE